MPKLYMLIGVPGSGKSTWIKNNVDIFKDAMIASTDNLIELAAKVNNKTYDQVFKEAIGSAEKAMYEMVMGAVKDDMNIIWDQTNLNRKNRAKKLIMIPDHYEKIAIFFSTPDDLDQRLANRPGKTIPYHVMKSMLSSLEYPQHDEGFDVIYDVITFNNRMEMYKELM